jgi:XapX domain-containing protein
MKPYLLSLAVGLLVGFIYSLLAVRSPAPPLIALVGLLGILIGEQAVPFSKRLMPDPLAATAIHARTGQEAAHGHAKNSQPLTNAHEDNSAEHER